MRQALFQIGIVLLITCVLVCGLTYLKSHDLDFDEAYHCYVLGRGC